MVAPSDSRKIAENIAVHDRIARRYDARHTEIFNEVEQTRLASTLQLAIEAIQGASWPLSAFDFGCGSGNLSRHLLSFGLKVTAADVSQGFLDLVRSRYPQIRTLKLSGNDLGNVADASFDLVATYSVLHHIPDYLSAVGELGRICKPGGVILIDHEQNEAFWNPGADYKAFKKAARRFDWRKYVRPSNYVHRLWRVIDPRHANEGDIHVWPDDHIEWDRVKAVLGLPRFEVVSEQDYLVFDALYRREVYEQYAGLCSDTKAMIFRKCAA